MSVETFHLTFQANFNVLSPHTDCSIL